MLSRLLFILIVFISTGFVDASEVLLYRDHGHIKFISDSDANSKDKQVQIDTKLRYWDWERIAYDKGCATNVKFYTNKGETHISFCIDLEGPDWLYLYLIDSEAGLSLKVERTKDKSVKNYQFSSYDELISKDTTESKIILVMIRERLHVTRILELKDIAIVQFHKQVELDQKLVDECSKLVDQLDDKSNAVRRHAYKEICDDRFMLVLPSMLRKELSIQQRLMVEAAKSKYEVKSEKLLPILDELVHAPGVW